MEEESTQMRGKRVEEWARREQGSGVDKGRGVGKGGAEVRVGRGGHGNGMMTVEGDWGKEVQEGGKRVWGWVNKVKGVG